MSVLETLHALNSILPRVKLRSLSPVSYDFLPNPFLRMFVQSGLLLLPWWSYIFSKTTSRFTLCRMIMEKRDWLFTSQLWVVLHSVMCGASLWNQLIRHLFKCTALGDISSTSPFPTHLGTVNLLLSNIYEMCRNLPSLLDHWRVMVICSQCSIFW